MPTQQDLDNKVNELVTKVEGLSTHPKIKSYIREFIADWANVEENRESLKTDKDPDSFLDEFDYGIKGLDSLAQSCINTGEKQRVSYICEQFSDKALEKKILKGEELISEQTIKNAAKKIYGYDPR
ncbi:MAG: hypothetical protein K9G62_05215 [Alphaproteobacteria bacterium]|nr:hypothetical protein [Alphaproteobacteria bacterium]